MLRRALALFFWLAFLCPATPEAYSITRLGYASICDVVVNNTTPKSTFCPVASDPSSEVKRTYPANTLTVGKSFYLIGGGSYVTPATNALSADININVGSSNVMTLVTPAAPATTSPQGIEFWAICTVRTTTTMNCSGSFKFIVAGLTGAPLSFNQTKAFDPTAVNLVDVTGDWNGQTTTQSTTVSQAVFVVLN